MKGCHHLPQAVRDLLQGPAARRGVILLVEPLLHPGKVCIKGFTCRTLHRHAECGCNLKPVTLDIPFFAPIACDLPENAVSLSPHPDKKIVGRTGKIRLIVSELQRQCAQ